MFSLFKKKEVAITRFMSLGVKYQPEGITQEDLDSCFQVQKKFNAKVYTQEDIQKIDENFGFKTEDYYCWIDVKIVNAGNSSSQSKILYRYDGSKGISNEESEQLFKDNIDPDLFYTRTQIQDIAAKIGCDVMKRNNFTSYSVVERTYPDGQIHKFVLPQNFTNEDINL